MKTLKQYKKEQMKNPEFAQAYEEIQPEMNIIRAMVDGQAFSPPNSVGVSVRAFRLPIYIDGNRVTGHVPGQNQLTFAQRHLLFRGNGQRICCRDGSNYHVHRLPGFHRITCSFLDCIYQFICISQQIHPLLMSHPSSVHRG